MEHPANAKQSTEQYDQPIQGHVSSIGASLAGTEADMFLRVTLCGMKAKVLVDIGVTLHLVSRRLMDQVTEALRPIK